MLGAPAVVDRDGGTCKEMHGAPAQFWAFPGRAVQGQVWEARIQTYFSYLSVRRHFLKGKSQGHK